MLDIIAIITPLMLGAPVDRINQVAAKSTQVAAKSAPLWSYDSDHSKTAAFLAMMSAKESCGDPSLVGDHGEAYGYTQIHWRIWLPFLRKEWILEARQDLFDPDKALVSTLAIMRHLTKVCGSVKAAAYAYASGSCKGNKVATPLMDYRCSLIGGC